MEFEEPDLVRRYREYVEFQLAIDGEGLGLRPARQALAERGSMPQNVMDLDEWVIEAVGTADYINPALLDDPRDCPLSHWWWHLGKLRAGTYPAHLLPPHLRVIYQPAERQAA